jgi:hypothetical protein
LKIKDVLAKVVAGEELTDAEKEALESYEEPNLEAAVNAKGKKERLKLQKQIDDLKEALADKDAEIEEANSGSSDIEKMQKQIDKLIAKSDAAETSLAAEREAHATTQRSNALNSLNVPWLESVPSNYRETVMRDAFADIDTEDLADGNVTAPILKSIIDGQKTFIQADTKGGAGIGAEKLENTSKNDSGTITKDNVLSLDPKTLVDNLDAAWHAASDGE